jgi:hypothetical protein
MVGRNTRHTLRLGPGPGSWWDELTDDPTAPSQIKHRWLYLGLYVLVIIGVGVGLSAYFLSTTIVSSVGN